MTDDIMADMFGEKLPGGEDKGENTPQNEAESQEMPQEAPETTEPTLRVEYVDDGAEKVDVAILGALGGEIDGEAETEPEDEMPEAWDLPEGDKKVAIMIPSRRHAGAEAPEGEIEDGPTNGSERR